jgi:hypothetical protein
MSSNSSDITSTANTSLSGTRFVVIACLAAWFVAAFGVSLFGLLRAGPSDLPMPIGLALLVPLLVGVLAYVRSSQFRQLLFKADLRCLIGIQLWRVAGAEFLIYYAYNQLPASFAFPAGVGDRARWAHRAVRCHGCGIRHACRQTDRDRVVHRRYRRSCRRGNHGRAQRTRTIRSACRCGHHGTHAGATA